MPRGRMINKKISLDQEVAKLSREANILYVWTLPHLDSEGKIHADPQILKGVVCPYLQFMSIKVIEKCLIELGNTPLVTIYGNEHKYMKYNGFNKNQNINKDKEAPSEIPDPTPDQLQTNSRPTPPKDKLSKDNIREGANAPTQLDFISSLKTNPAYKHINLDMELNKMDAWLSLPKNKGRKKTPRFILHWLNKIEQPMDIKSQGKIYV